MRDIKFEYIISGPVTRAGTVFAQGYREAREQVKKTLQPGETIYSLNISRR